MFSGAPVAAAEPASAETGPAPSRVRSAVQALAHRPLVVATLLYAAVTVAITWPLLLHIGRDVPGQPTSDSYEFLWKLWWVPHALHHLQNPFFAPQIFPQAGGYDLGSTDMSPSASFLFLPLTVIAGATATYGVIILLNFAGGAAGAFALCRRLGGGVHGAFIAGLAFGFCPFIWNQLIHLNVLQTGYIPWVFWSADRLLAQRRRRDGVIFGVLFALASLTTWYTMIFLLLTVPVFALVRWRQLRTRGPRLPFVLAPAVAAVIVVPFLVPALAFAASPNHHTTSFGDSAFYALSVEDYVMPPHAHPVTQYWIDVAASSGNYERIVYPGLFVLALGLIALTRRQALRAAAAVATAGAVAVVLSYGPVLRWFGTPVVAALHLSDGGTLHNVAQYQANAGPGLDAIPLPVYPLARYAPLLHSLRTWERAAEVADLCFAVMAGIGLTLLLSRVRRRWISVAVTAVVAALVLVDAHTTDFGWTQPQPRPVDRWLAAQPGDFRIAEMPWAVGQTGGTLYYAEFHGKEVAFAQTALLPGEVGSVVDTMIATFPDGNPWLRILERWQVRYMLVDSTYYHDPILDEVLDSKGVTRVTRQGTVTVYQLPGAST